jgi:4-hydroxythreonine-4-phosphate dehydrogenase
VSEGDKKPKQPLRIAITTGDADGIGTEVTAKALAKLKPLPGVQFYLWRSPVCPTKHLSLIDRAFKRLTVNTWPEALKAAPDSHKQLVDISSNLPPPVWVETSAQASHFGHIDAMVTAPLSKTAIASAGFKDMGHTGILKRVSRSKELFMGFIGDKFNVVLATGHVPIEEVHSHLTPARLERALRAADQLRQVLDKKSAAKPIALVGLNPHAGEEGLIGSTEEKVHRAVMEAVREKGMKVEGPLVPDAAFFKENWSRYSVYLANYHDQGLIPFKMIHGQESGIHVTLGLPFVRTSVDHGTAKDIFGKNKADASSMTLAIEWAVRLCKSSAVLTF